MRLDILNIELSGTILYLGSKNRTDALYDAALICVLFSDCPQLSSPDNGLLDDLDPRQGTVTNAFCFGGYTLFGASTLTCQADASWDYLMPECRMSKYLRSKWKTSIVFSLVCPHISKFQIFGSHLILSLL